MKNAVWTYRFCEYEPATKQQRRDLGAARADSAALSRELAVACSRLARLRRGFGVCALLEQVLFELVAGLDSELAKRLAEVVVDGARADEQLRGDLLVSQTVCREIRDLCFLGGQVVAGLDGPFARMLAGRLELDPGALGERSHAEVDE